MLSWKDHQPKYINKRVVFFTNLVLNIYFQSILSVPKGIEKPIEKYRTRIKRPFLKIDKSDENDPKILHGLFLSVPRLKARNKACERE